MIVTLDEAKTYLGVSGSDDDTTITSFITAAGRSMEDFCRRRLESADVTEYLDGTGARVLYLREPAESVTSIHTDSDRAWGDDKLVSASDYLLVTGRDGTGCAIEYLDHLWTEGQRNVRVIYKAGFTTLPDALKHACRIQVARLYGEWQRARQGLDVLESQNVAGWAQTWLTKQGLDPAAVDLLQPYVNAGL